MAITPGASGCPVGINRSMRRSRWRLPTPLSPAAASMAVRGSTQCCATVGSAVAASASHGSAGAGVVCGTTLPAQAAHDGQPARLPDRTESVSAEFYGHRSNRKMGRRYHRHRDPPGVALPSGHCGSYSRRAVGYAMDIRRDEALVETALEMALLTRRPQAGLVHHSDRGSQYTSGNYRAILESYGIV